MEGRQEIKTRTRGTTKTGVRRERAGKGTTRFDQKRGQDAPTGSDKAAVRKSVASHTPCDGLADSFISHISPNLPASVQGRPPPFQQHPLLLAQRSTHKLYLQPTILRLSPSRAKAI
jgi:hypothetical protein